METALLAIPETCAEKIITLHHFSLFVGNQGVIKTYLTIGDIFFIPGLIHYLQSYIKGCHICQLSANDKLSMTQLQTRINLNYRLLSRLSKDLKVMPRSYKGHKYILCIKDEATNYLITVPIYQSRLEKISDALIENVISKYCVSNYIKIDQDSVFMSSLMKYLFKKHYIKIKTVAPYNHQSLQAKHGITPLSTIVTKYVTDLGKMWPRYLPLATLAYNTFNTLNVANYSPYELAFGRKPKLPLDLETNPCIEVSGMFKEYYTLLNKTLQYLHKLIQEFKTKRLAMINIEISFNITLEI